jgi:hypothetical protein
MNAIEMPLAVDGCPESWWGTVEMWSLQVAVRAGWREMIDD